MLHHRHHDCHLDLLIIRGRRPVALGRTFLAVLLHESQGLAVHLKLAPILLIKLFMIRLRRKWINIRIQNNICMFLFHLNANHLNDFGVLFDVRLERDDKVDVEGLQLQYFECSIISWIATKTTTTHSTKGQVLTCVHLPCWFVGSGFLVAHRSSAASRGLYEMLLFHLITSWQMCAPSPRERGGKRKEYLSLSTLLCARGQR